MGRSYLVRYGMARSLGRFEANSGSFDRGQPVVIRTHRGVELGEVVVESPSPSGPDSPPEPLAPILRPALAGDLERADAARLERQAHFETCRRVFEEGDWPLILVDAEPLLEPGRVALLYLGPHRLDSSGLVAALRDRLALDVVLEPVGRDVPEPEPEPGPEPDAHGCGSCGSDGGCGSCGSASSGCAVKALVASRRRVAVDA